MHVVVPHDVGDPAVPSGGNAYDRRIQAGLADAGRAVREVPVAGDWPRPGPTARAALGAALDGLPDGAVVLLDGLVACGVPEVVVPRADRLRLVVLVHLPLGEEAPELAPAEGAVLRAVDAVVATSPWTARRIAAVHGLDAARVHVAAPGVDPAPPARGSGGTHLLSVGSITPTKGHDVLVDALATVEGRWTCDLVGPLRRDPAHVARLRAAISTSGLEARIRLIGPLTGADLDAAFDAADLLVLPSRVEAYGMVVTEALARGIPVVASAVGGVPEVLTAEVPGGPGLLVPPAVPAALAGALRRWLGEPDLRAALRRAAAARRGTLPGWEVTTRCLDTALSPAPRTLDGTPA